MSNFAETQQLVNRFIQARIPLIVINTMEPRRVDELLESISETTLDHRFFTYTRIDGLRDTQGGQAATEDKGLFSALEQTLSMFKARPNVNLILHDAEDLSQDTTQARHLASVVREAEANQGSIIVIVDKPVWTGLSRLGMTLQLDLPDKDELYETVVGVFEANSGGTALIEWGEDEMRRAAEILVGITEAEAINVLASLIVKGAVHRSDLAELSRFKDQIFGELTGIERVNLDDNYEIGGLANLKRWLNKRASMITADLSHTSLRPPRGVLLCGVPGCGKSLSAKAIAQEWEMPLYRLDLSSIQGMYHGESENNLREALATADRVAPCVLWIDEIEKGLATSSSDNSVMRRLVGQFLFWLQESTSKVFLVATANEVSSLPPELLRKGRFDELFFIDLPTGEERKEILELSFNRYLRSVPEPRLISELVKLSKGFAGSDIDAVVHDIAADMFALGQRELPHDEYIRNVFSNVVPFSQSNPEEVQAIRQWGEHRAIPAGAPEAAETGGSSQSGKFRRVLVQ